MYQLAKTTAALAERAFVIPLSDQHEFIALPLKERLRIRRMLDAFDAISKSKSRVAACKAVATIVHVRGFSWKSLYRKYCEYMELYDWRVCVRKYKGRFKPKPEEFRKFIGRLVSECQGRTDIGEAVRDRFIHDFWFAGKEVPGYGTFSDFWADTQCGKPYPRELRDEPPFTPTGWSRSRITDLIREVSARNSALRAITAHGFHAGHDHWTHMLRDKSKLRPLQLVTADDVELDIQCLFKIKNAYQVCTAQAVVALDVATGMIIGYGVRPIYKTDEGERRMLTRADVNAVLLNMLQEYGLPANYQMHLLLENAAATLCKEDRDLLETMMPGCFVIENTRMAERKLLSKGFVEKRGMPYQKGWIESAFRPLHTRLAYLPGVTAPRFDFRRDDHAAKVKYTLAVVNDALKQGVNVEDLRLPVLTIDEFYPIFEHLVKMYNARTRHNLQGFDYVYETMLEDCSFARREDCANWPAEMLAGREFKRRLESPLERFAKLAAREDIRKVAMPVLYPLMQKKHTVTVRNCRLIVQDEEFSQDKLYYHSPRIEQLHGQEVIAAFTPDYETAWLFRKDEGFICAVPRQGRTDITTQTEILKRSGEVHRERMRVASQAAELLEDRNNYYAEMRTHNEAILAGNAAIGGAMLETEAKVKRNAKTRQKALENFTSENIREETPAPVIIDGGDDFDPSDFGGNLLYPRKGGCFAGGLLKPKRPGPT